jgi:hypothetical protein
MKIDENLKLQEITKLLEKGGKSHDCGASSQNASP